MELLRDTDTEWVPGLVGHSQGVADSLPLDLMYDIHTRQVSVLVDDRQSLAENWLGGLPDEIDAH